MDDKHLVIQAIKELAIKLGRVPTRDEFRTETKLERKMMRQFFAYTIALQAAGLNKFSNTKIDSERVIPSAYKYSKPMKYKISQLQGHKVHEFDLEEIFASYGNPNSIKILAQPDTHIPNEDKRALDCFLQFAAWYKPHVDIIGGDLGDFEPMSHWPPGDAKPRRWKDDRKALQDFLCKKRIILGDECKYLFYIEGNHESWLQQALSAKVPEFFDGMEDVLSIPALLNLDELDYKFIPVNQFLKLGKLYLTHGLYTANNHPDVHLNKLKCNILYFHLHDIKNTNQISIDGGMVAASGGCLCRLDAKFLKGKPNNWVHSFFAIEMFRDGTFSYVTPQIHDGKLSFAGQYFESKL
jgi:hypothetical protein